MSDQLENLKPEDLASGDRPLTIPPELPVLPLRDTVLHVITETACHAGHLDAARELIDGQTWLILP